MPRVLSVGQCAMDHGTISRFLIKAFCAQVSAAGTFQEAMKSIQEGVFDLVLINRVSDRDGSQGLDLIRSLKTDSSRRGLPVMLVSNFAESQAQAEALGALPGFGKANLNTQGTRERLEAVLNHAATQSREV